MVLYREWQYSIDNGEYAGMASNRITAIITAILLMSFVAVTVMPAANAQTPNNYVLVWDWEHVSEF